MALEYLLPRLTVNWHKVSSSSSKQSKAKQVDVFVEINEK